MKSESGFDLDIKQKTEVFNLIHHLKIERLKFNVEQERLLFLLLDVECDNYARSKSHY